MESLIIGITALIIDVSSYIILIGRYIGKKIYFSSRAKECKIGSAIIIVDSLIKNWDTSESIIVFEVEHK